MSLGGAASAARQKGQETKRAYTWPPFPQTVFRGWEISGSKGRIENEEGRRRGGGGGETSHRMERKMEVRGVYVMSKVTKRINGRLGLLLRKGTSGKKSKKPGNRKDKGKGPHS